MKTRKAVIKAPNPDKKLLCVSPTAFVVISTVDRLSRARPANQVQQPMSFHVNTSSTNAGDAMMLNVYVIQPWPTSAQAGEAGSRGRWREAPVYQAGAHRYQSSKHYSDHNTYVTCS